MKLWALLERYVASQYSRGVSELTTKNQRSHLGRFLAFLEGEGVAEGGDITRELIEAYMDVLAWTPMRRGRLMKPETRNVRLASIKAFCRWLYETDVIALDPAQRVAYCREPATLPRSILSPEEMTHLLAAPSPQTALGVRDRLVLELLYSTGLRLRELCALDVTDLDLGEGFARVRHGKGDRERVVPVGKLACELLTSYLAAVRPAFLRARGSAGASEPAVILSRYGERLGPRGVAKLVARCAKCAGLSVRVTPHTFRHSCATHMLRGGANIRHLQEMLGHKRVSSTEVYTRVTIAELKAAHAKYHPRGVMDEVELRGRRFRDQGREGEQR
jgi:integrase/recombinase XerD